MQISDDLVKYIAGEIKKRLDASPPRRALILVGRFDDLSATALARLQERFDVREHLNWDDPVPTEAAVLIAKLGLQALVRVAEGDEGCTVEGRALLAALLNGQPVAALKDGLAWRAYMATAPRALLARYAHCENVLISYGLKLVAEEEAAEALLGRAPAPAVFGGGLASPPAAPASAAPGGGRPEGAAAKHKGRVLTEADIMTLCPASRGFGQNLSLNPGDILTPLAKDYAQAMKIAVAKA
ncbi:MAG: hypothetical protein LBS31_05150 [Candidatus Adiutrix sp.]|jgi:hypothetical protein|nr:hypothetical protein [Candidatus Adiutrix sp.]